MLYSTKQIEDGIVDITQVDLDQYAKKVNVPTNDEFDSLTTTVANKLDRQPMHTHYISQVEELQQELDNINGTIRNNKASTDDVLKNHYDAIVKLAGTHGMNDNNANDGNKFTTTDEDTGGVLNKEIKNRLTTVEQNVNNITPEIEKIKSGKADKEHTHTMSDITDYQEPTPYDDTEMRTLVSNKADKEHTHSVNDINELFNKIYPVGSIYTSTVNTSPSTMFGGTWVSIENKFLYAVPTSESSKQTGGSKQITTENLPAHTHTFNGNAIKGSAQFYGTNQPSSLIIRTSNCFSDGIVENPTTERVNYVGTASNFTSVLVFNATPSGTISSTGTGSDYMPPYMTVYAWERTAL